MSILLSAYFPEGIVFAADKNVTLLYSSARGSERDVEVGATAKIVPWPRERAVVGYCGLGRVAGLPLSEWMRQFAAQTRDFEDIAKVAKDMRDLIQRDFDQDFPEGTDVRKMGLIVHFGGFRYEEGNPVPVMYHITNIPGSDAHGDYLPATRTFRGPSDELQRLANEDGVRHPSDLRPWLKRLDSQGNLAWFNNGMLLPAFNVFKVYLWHALMDVRRSGLDRVPSTPSLDDRAAYCAMSVELFGSFFRHHFLPAERGVGGGVDCVAIPWPKP